MPLLAGLRHGCASLVKFILSPLSAVPATVAGGIVVAFASPLLRPFGISKDSILQLLFGSALCAAVGYAAGRWLATRKADPDSQHRRGAVVTREQPQPPPRRRDTYVSCLHIESGGWISDPPAVRDTALFVVHGSVTVWSVELEMRLDPSPGVGIVLNADHAYRLESDIGAIVLVVEADTNGVATSTFDVRRWLRRRKTSI